LYILVLQSLSVLNENATDVTFQNPIYRRVRGDIGQDIEISMRDDNLEICRLKTITCFVSRPFPQKVEQRGPASSWRRRHGRWRAFTQEKKGGDWDDQSLDRELFKGLSHDRVLCRRVTDPSGSPAAHVHRHYGHVRPWRKSLDDVSLPLVGSADFFDSMGNAPETYHRHFANVLIVNGPQYYYWSSRIQPDDIDTCGLYCLY
jgi:hypothetical protein